MFFEIRRRSSMKIVESDEKWIRRELAKTRRDELNNEFYAGPEKTPADTNKRMFFVARSVNHVLGRSRVSY